MDWDEQKSKPAAGISLGDDLATMSVGELEARIAALTREIDRVKAEIATKKARNAAADSLFKR